MYADFIEEEGQTYSMNKFFFYAKDAHMMLSSLSFMDEDLAQSQYIYEILEGGTTRASKAEEV